MARGQDFSGTWKLKSQRVEAGSLPEAAVALLEIEHPRPQGGVRGGRGTVVLHHDGKEVRTMVGRRSLNTVSNGKGQRC